MRHRQPVLGPGWGPIATPPAAPRLWPKVRRQFIIGGALTLVALFTGILASPRGGLAVLLAWPLVNLLLGAPQRFRKVIEWGTVAVVAAIVASAGTGGPKIAAPPLRAPVQVEASQTDLLDQARRVWADAWEKTIAQAGADPQEEARR